MGRILDNPLIKKLISLKFSTSDYAVFGSGPMFAHRIKDLGHDIDIIARGSVWDKVRSLEDPVRAETGTGYVVKLFSGELEIFNNWAPGMWDVDELIDTAEVFDGIRFVTLQNVIKWKELFGRDKDKEHVKMIREYLSSKKTTG